MSQTKAQLLDGSVVSVSFGAGSAAAPSINYSADTTTGIYFPGSGQLAISTNGSGRLFVNSAGDVAIGQSSPVSISSGYGSFTVNGTNGGGFALQYAGTTRGYIYVDPLGLQYNVLSTNPHIWYNNGSERMRLDSSGRLGIGTSSPSGKLSILQDSSSNTTPAIRITGSAGDPTNYYLDVVPILSGSTVDYRFDLKSISTNTALLYLSGAGRVGIGTSSPVYRLDVTGGGIGINTSAGTAASIVFNQSGVAASEIGLNASDSGLVFKGWTGAALAERMRIDSSGRLLVGTSSARSNFNNNLDGATLAQVEGTTFSTSSLSVTRNSNDTGSPAIEITKTRGTSNGQNTIVTNGDPFGFVNFAGTDGTNSVRGASISAWCDGTPGTGSMPGRLVFSTTPSGSASPTERMRITSSGSVQSTNWTFSPSAINSRAAYFGVDPAWGGAGQGGLVAVNTSNGVVLGVSATSWASYSDIRMKTDLVPIENGLTKVSTLRAVTGRYSTDDASTSRSFLIAQDVEKVLPEAVESGNPDALGLRYTEVIPLLVAALKESKERIETLETEVAALKGA